MISDDLRREITQRTRLERELEASSRALQESEERLSLALLGSELGLWDWNVQTGAIVINEQWATMLGYRRDDIEPHVDACRALVHPDDLPGLMRSLEAHLRGETPFYETEHRMRTKGGTWKWVLDRGKVVERDRLGNPLRAAGTYRDITERKRAAAALRESQRVLATLINNLPGAVYRCGAEPGYPIEFISGGCLALTGYRAADFVARHVSFDSDLIHEDDRHVTTLRRREAIAAQRPYQCVYRIRRADGVERYLWEQGTGVWNDRNQLLCLEGFITDVTERRRAQEAGRRLELKMRDVQKLESLGVLAGGIAHDFNNLLTGIIGHASLALETCEGRTRESLEQIGVAARRAADLCQQLLAYSGRGRFVVRALDLSDVVREMVQMLDVVISKKATLRMELTNGLPAVEADAAQIRQIVMNLLTNASDALGDSAGTITIATGVRHCDPAYLRDTCSDIHLPAGDYVTVRVADSGCGMDAEARARMFDPFFTTKFAGRGLGLAAVLGIVRGHQGALKVDSEPGRGTVVTVLLPASDAPPRPLRGDEPADAWTGSGTILVVDDEDAVRSFLRETLPQFGFDVLMATNGREAVETFQECADGVALILLDLTMPELGGEEVLERVRALRADVPVILSSGYDESESRDRLADDAATHFLHKPYAPDELRRALRQALDQR